MASQPAAVTLPQLTQKWALRILLSSIRPSMSFHVNLGEGMCYHVLLNIHTYAYTNRGHVYMHVISLLMCRHVCRQISAGMN